VRREFSVLRQGIQGAGGRWFIAAVWHDLGPERKREAQLRVALEQLEKQQQANEVLRKESAQGSSGRDSDTGLHNRAHFEDQLRREVDLSTREHREFALVSIEIDPLADDVAAIGAAPRLRVLEALGRLLRGNTRAMDASCRYEDNRFSVLLSGVGLATAHSRMEGLRRRCATQIVLLDGQELGFTVDRVTLYDAVPAASLGAIAAEVRAGTLSGVLLYSPRTARLFASAVAGAGLDQDMAQVICYCLSPNVALALPVSWTCRVAKHADEQGMLAMLDRGSQSR